MRLWGYEAADYGHEPFKRLVEACRFLLLAVAGNNAKQMPTKIFSRKLMHNNFERLYRSQENPYHLCTICRNVT
jgi:hypothetical protein